MRFRLIWALTDYKSVSSLVSGCCYVLFFQWWARKNSNLRPLPCQGSKSLCSPCEYARKLLNLCSLVWAQLGAKCANWAQTHHARAKQADDKYWRKNTTQLLIEWQSWTGEAKVSRRGMATLAHLWQPVNASRMKTITQGDPGRLHCRIPEELFIETGIMARARRISITELVVESLTEKVRRWKNQQERKRNGLKMRTSTEGPGRGMIAEE